MWKDVHLASDEVAIIWGQTATQASAGLFRPATYRVVNSYIFLIKPDRNPCWQNPSETVYCVDWLQRGSANISLCYPMFFEEVSSLFMVCIADLLP